MTTSLVDLQAATIGLLTALAMLLDSSPVGIATIILLTRLVTSRPARALAIWGAVYVPVTAIWTLPALNGVFEMAGAVLGYSLCGVVFYGGAELLLSRILRAYPSLVFGTSIGVAEASSTALGLVMAPVGLFAVDGSLGYLIAWFGVIGASAAIGLAASLAERYIRFALPVAVLVGFVLCQVAGPPRPDYNEPQVHGIAHYPDPKLKWSSPSHADEYFDRLQKMSDLVAGDGLIVWPEGAVTETFDLGEAISKLDPNHLPLLFGMTRYSREGSPDLRNSAVLVTHEGVQISDKERLVPFFEGGVPFLYDSDLQPGTRRILTLPDETKILPLICFEVFMPRAWFQSRPDADLIVVLSAEAGFQPGITPSILDRHVKARELEAGLRVVRVSDRSTSM